MEAGEGAVVRAAEEGLPSDITEDSGLAGSCAVVLRDLCDLRAFPAAICATTCLQSYNGTVLALLSTTMEMPPLSVGQRIVLEHTTGPYKGLKQIMGHSDEFGGQPPPASTEPFDISPGTRKGIASLVASKTRYLLYREVTIPADLGTFDRRQR